MTEQPPENSTKSNEPPSNLEHSQEPPHLTLTKEFLPHENSPSISEHFPPSDLFSNQSFLVDESIYCSFSNYFNPFLEQLNSINQYFPEYQPLFTYLTFCLSKIPTISNEKEVPEQPSKSPEDAASKKNLKEGSISNNFDEIPFPLSRRVLIFAPSGHGLSDFFSLYGKLYHIQIFHLDVYVSNEISKIPPNYSLSHHLNTRLPIEMEGNVVLSVYIHFTNSSSRISPQNSHTLSLTTLIQTIIRDLFTGFNKNHFPILIVLEKSLTNEISPSLISQSDFVFNFNLPSYQTRVQFLKALPSLIPKNSLDMEHIAHQMDNWNFDHIVNFYKSCQQYFVMENWDKKWKKKEITTEYILNVLESGIFQPDIKQKSNISESLLTSSSSLSSQLNESDFYFLQRERTGYYNPDFVNQLFQEIASFNYNEITLILDKLQRGIKLHKDELSILGNYPFLLKFQPKDALNRLQKAKQRLSQIEKINIQPK
ncbi:MAG: hypothetical protein DRO88_02070 [Promethearchaeia archaeon]|nr:MAG: hypothetical protein DRO88_02070 [Candidatus Lokiarchaeia archaeon]